MQFSDTTDKKGLIQDCEFLSNLSYGAISGNAARLDTFVRLINANYHKVVTMVLQAQDEWDFDDINHTDYPILTTSLVADQRDYTLPASEKVLKIKRVDICYDGTGNTCYKAEPLDISESGLGFGNDSDVDGRYSKTAPKYDTQYNSLFIYPRANADNVTNSGIIKIQWTREVDEFSDTDTTQEPGLDEPFHRMLSIGAALDWAVAKGKSNVGALAQMMADYEARLKQYYGSKQLDRNVILKSDFIDYN